ncbi:MAG: double zinc ribbon domain-containing protein [Thermodesulfobacteriota bacterium]
MPQCSHCQTQYESGQRYCSTCGSFLLHPEEGDTFCPQCGVRVSPRQEFCHECDAPLKGAKAAAEILGPETATPAESPPAPATPKGTPSWLIGLMVGTGIVIIILLVLLFSRGTSPPPAPPPQAPKAEAPVTPTTPAAPAPSTSAAPTPEQTPPATADLKEQLQSVLSLLREAQVHKDIVQFMSVYSATYPQLDDKRGDTLKSWENFDFTNLVFTFDKIQLLDPDNAIAQVTWYMDTRNRRNQELASITQTYEVRFAKEMGTWRIRFLEEVEK